MVFLKTEREVFTPTSSFATRIRSNESKNFAGRSAELPAFFGGGEGRQRERSLPYPENSDFGEEFYNAIRLRSVIPA
jgi:hypothetical protein